MIKFLMAAVAALSIGAAAEAATINTTVSFSQALNVSGNALQSKALVLANTGPQTFVSDTFTTPDLLIGDSFSTDLFVVRTTNSVVRSDEPNPRPFALLFATNYGNVTVTGTTYALTQGGTSTGVMAFDGPAFINLGNSQRLKIALADVFFNQGPAGTFTPGKADGGIASVTLSVAAVPLPAAGLMLLVGLGALAVARGRRSQA